MVAGQVLSPCKRRTVQRCTCCEGGCAIKAILLHQPNLHLHLPRQQFCHRGYDPIHHSHHDQHNQQDNPHQAMLVKWHFLLGTHKLLDPVSKTTFKVSILQRSFHLVWSSWQRYMSLQTSRKSSQYWLSHHDDDYNWIFIKGTLCICDYLLFDIYLKRQQYDDEVIWSTWNDWGGVPMLISPKYCKVQSYDDDVRRCWWWWWRWRRWRFL